MTTLTVVLKNVAPPSARIMYVAIVQNDDTPPLRRMLRLEDVGTSLPPNQEIAALLSQECVRRLGVVPDVVVIDGQTYAATWNPIPPTSPGTPAG